MLDFREQVKSLCKKQGITQKQLAEKLGITNVSLNITLSKQYPQLQTLEKIATALNVSIGEFFIMEEDKAPTKVVIEKVPYFVCPHCGKEVGLFARSL